MILPDRKTMKCEELYEDCHIRMYEHEFLANLHQFELTDFGVMLGKDWLAKYQGQIHYPKQKTLRGLNRKK